MTFNYRHTTIYYAVEHLHSRHIVVMGHYGCGGVAAAIASPPPEPMSEADKGIQEWIKPIRDTYSSSDRLVYHIDHVQELLADATQRGDRQIQGKSRQQNHRRA